MPKSKCLNLETKRKILSDLTNTTRKEICNRYSISKSCLCRISKKENQISSFHGNAKIRKKLIPEKMEAQDKILLEWIDGLRRRGIPVSGTFIQHKAQLLFPSEPKLFSKMWLYRFLARINYTSKRICGEEMSVDIAKVNEWRKSALSKKLENFTPENVFNCDESALFYKKIPSRTYDLKGQNCFGIKVSKERVTFLACCSSDGLTKLPLLVIGKSKRPRCFKNSTVTGNYVYRSTKNAWMTKCVFSEWVTSLNSQFIAENRNVLLILDNFSGHILDEEFSNVDLLFLPPNSTSKIQPLDAGIINCIKAKYSQKIVSYLDSGDKNLKDVTLAMGVEMICQAWDEIEAKTIVNCFNKCLKSD